MMQHDLDNPDKRLKGNHTSATFEDLASQFAPFDAILFQGGDIVSNTIMIIEEMSTSDLAEFSHMGMLVNSDILPTISQLIPGRWYVFESTMSMKFYSSVQDTVSKKGKFGVQIRDFEEVISSYPGRVAWAKLLNNPWRQDFIVGNMNVKAKEVDIKRNKNNADENDGDKPFMIQDLSFANVTLIQRRELLAKEMTAIYSTYKARIYNVNCLDLCAAAFKCLRPIRDKLDEIVICDRKILNNMATNKPLTHGTTYNPFGWIFCSQLIAICWKQIGVLNSSIDPRDWLPISCLGTTDYKCIVYEPIFILINTNHKL